MADYQQHTHEFAPVFNKDSKILILGTFPSAASREHHFYYGHPRNRFWKVLAYITKEPLPTTIYEKQQLLLSHHIAIWDVIQSCEIIGSSDSSIRNVVPSNISNLLSQTSISAIFGNGNKACELFKKYISLTLSDFPNLKEIKKLPSTSPANASWSLEQLNAFWAEQLSFYLVGENSHFCQ